MNRPAKVSRGFLFRHWKTLVKVTLVVALLAWLARKGFLSLEATRNALMQPEKILPAAFLHLTCACIGVIRWQWLLRAQNLNLPLRKTFQLTFIGNFFNIALPGAVSGDFVKAFYVGREMQGRRGHAFGSILFDRVAGLSALVLVSASALLLGFGSFQGTALFAGVRVLLFVAAAGVLSFYGYLFLVRERHDPVLRLFRWLEGRHPVAKSLTHTYEGLRYYHSHRLMVLRVLVISVFIHCAICVACLLFAQALGVTDLPILSVAVIVPLGLLVTAVPVLPGGIGTGHAAFGWLFHYLGTQRGADIFSLFVLFQFITGGIGGLIYLRFKATAPALELPSDSSK